MRAERLAAINQVAVTVHHEINSPLTTMLLGVELLLDSELPLSARGREIANEVEASAIRIRDVVRKLEDIEDRPVTYLDDIKMIDIRWDPEQSDPEDPKGA